MADGVLTVFDHLSNILSTRVVVLGDRVVVEFRIFDEEGLHTFMVDTSEATQLIDVLKTAVAQDAESRLSAKETAPAPGVFGSYGSGR